MRGATIRHMTLAVGLVLLLRTLRSQPAAAHSTNGSHAPRYRTRLDGLAPPVAGLTATVDPRGEWIQVTNATGKTLTILWLRAPVTLFTQSAMGARSGGKVARPTPPNPTTACVRVARGQGGRRCGARAQNGSSAVGATQRASPAPGSPSRVAVDVVCVEFGLLGVDAGYRYDLGVWMEGGI